MHIHTYEKTIIGLTLGFLVVALTAIGGSVFGSHIHLPGPAMRIDPRTVRETPPFNNPGVRQAGAGEYEAVMIAQTWAFVPQEVQVPRGATVTFKIASADVTHGFLIERTNVNLTLIPGYVAEATATFREPGIYHVFCHEYCGVGHQNMFARVIVQ